MAYPVVSAPYGLQPINRLDDLPYAGAIRQIPIASTYNTAIYYGDIVRIASGGVISKSTVTSDALNAAANNTSGVFVGVAYTNTQSQPVEAQYYPGNVAATNAVAYVVDDPNAVFKVAITYSGNTTITTATESIVGTNVQVRQGTGSTTTGDSAVSVVVPTAGLGNSANLPLRVVQVVPDTNVTSTTFCEVIVKFNNHQYYVASANDYA